MGTTKTTAIAGAQDRESQPAEKVRLKWEPMRFSKYRHRAVLHCVGISLIVDKVHLARGCSTWTAYVGPNDCGHFETKEEAQLGCESVLTRMLLRELGNMLGENWTDAPGKTRLRIVMDIEADDVTGEHEHRAIHSFVIDRNTHEIRRMHANECATNEGKLGNCLLNNTTPVEGKVLAAPIGGAS